MIEFGLEQVRNANAGEPEPATPTPELAPKVRPSVAVGMTPHRLMLGQSLRKIK